MKEVVFDVLRIIFSSGLSIREPSVSGVSGSPVSVSPVSVSLNGFSHQRHTTNITVSFSTLLDDDYSPEPRCTERLKRLVESDDECGVCDTSDGDETHDDQAVLAPSSSCQTIHHQLVYRVSYHHIYEAPVLHVRAQTSEGVPLASADVLNLVARMGGTPAAFGPDLSLACGDDYNGTAWLVMHPCGGVERALAATTTEDGSDAPVSATKYALAWYQATAAAAGWAPLSRADFARLDRNE